jgi:hypothetical protein
MTCGFVSRSKGPWRTIYLLEDRLVHFLAVVGARRDLDEWVGEQGVRSRLAKP